MTTVFVNEHEYLKMVRAREDRIRTFMQLELEACLEEVRWSITRYNCEVLGCPQEEYPARLLPTLPPDYEVNLTNRLRAAQKGILPASLRMILNSENPQSVLRYGSQVPVQPDNVTGEHRVEHHSTASECDLSPRHAAVVTRSEKLETPPKSPAISTGLDKPGISPAFGADTLQTDESFFPFEASTEDLLDEYVTSTIRTSMRCSINETEKKKLQLLNKQPLARSLRDLQFASYGRPRRQAYKASSSTGAA